MEWVKCSDLEPAYGQSVIVSDGSDVGVWRFRGFWPDHNGNGCSNQNSATELLREVTHWMPLPEPPTE